MVGLVSTAGIGFEEVDVIIADPAYQQGGTEWPATSVLGEGLFEIADFLSQYFNRNRVIIGYPIDLAFNPCPVDQLSAISDQTTGCKTDVVINLEQLLDALGNDETAGYSLIADQNYSFTELETYGGGTSFHRFARIFYLEESSIWTESGDAMVISSSARLHSIT